MPKRQPIPHGTYRGAQYHYRRGELPLDEDCARARAEYQAKQRRSPEYRDRLRDEVTRLALRRLVNAHRVEFDRYIREQADMLAVDMG